MSHFTAEFLASLVGGTLVEYKIDKGPSGGEHARGEIVSSGLSDDELRIHIIANEQCFFQGLLSMVHNVRDLGGVTFFSIRILDIDYAVAPPGVTIPGLG
jgi:hypothetical protein